MAYLSDPAGLGVSKTQGEQSIGGSTGGLPTSGAVKQGVFEVTAGTSDRPYSHKILNAHLVKALYLDVGEAFAASSTADLSIDGGAGLTTDLDLATAGLSSPALTGLTKLAGDGPVDVVLTLDANAKASATGEAKVIVEYVSL